MADYQVLKITGLDNVLSTLQKLPQEVASTKRGGPVALSLRKGAKVFVEEARKNLERVKEPNTTGLLSKAIVVRRAKSMKTNGERMSVRISKKKYPNRSERKKKGMPDTTLKAGQILEYGSSRQRARPWLRPTFAAKKEDALNTVVEDLKKRVDKLAKKHLGGG